MGGKDDERNVWEKPLIFHVVAEKWPLLFQIFPSKNRTFDFEKNRISEKNFFTRVRACACARPPPAAPRMARGV